MGKADYLELGSWNAQCDYCGFKFKAHMLVRNWQGLMVCHKCFEPRQTQDFVRAVPDVQTPPWSRPRPTAVYNNVCTPTTRSAVAGSGVAGCAEAGYLSPAFVLPLT